MQLRFYLLVVNRAEIYEEVGMFKVINHSIYCSHLGTLGDIIK